MKYFILVILFSLNVSAVCKNYQCTPPSKDEYKFRRHDIVFIKNRNLLSKREKFDNCDKVGSFYIMNVIEIKNEVIYDISPEYPDDNHDCTYVSINENNLKSVNDAAGLNK